MWSFESFMLMWSFLWNCNFKWPISSHILCFWKLSKKNYAFHWQYWTFSQHQNDPVPCIGMNRHCSKVCISICFEHHTCTLNTQLNKKKISIKISKNNKQNRKTYRAFEYNHSSILPKLSIDYNRWFWFQRPTFRLWKPRSQSIWNKYDNKIAFESLFHSIGNTVRCRFQPKSLSVKNGRLR